MALTYILIYFSHLLPGLANVHFASGFEVSHMNVKYCLYNKCQYKYRTNTKLGITQLIPPLSSACSPQRSLLLIS
jgi:hypothetical protein